VNPIIAVVMNRMAKSQWPKRMWTSAKGSGIVTRGNVNELNRIRAVRRIPANAPPDAALARKLSCVPTGAPCCKIAVAGAVPGPPCRAHQRLWYIDQILRRNPAPA